MGPRLQQQLSGTMVGGLVGGILVGGWIDFGTFIVHRDPVCFVCFPMCMCVLIVYIYIYIYMYTCI